MELRTTQTDAFKIQQLNHAQVFTAQLTLGENFKVSTDQSNFQLIQASLLQKGVNLIPIVVRKLTTSLNEKNLEIICGQEWFIAAEKLGIQRLWAWIFDLTDDEAREIREEMNLLFSQPNNELSQLRQELNSLQKQFSDFQTKVDSSLTEILDNVKPKILEININDMKKDDLQKLDGIGEKYARVIIENQPFLNSKDLDQKLSKRIVNILMKYKIVF